MIILNRIKCDLTVAGGGIAGMCAAVAAARKGMSVVLINDRSVLGGNASSEIGVRISGASHHTLNPAIYAKECGLIEELRLDMDSTCAGEGYGYLAMLDAVFFDFIYKEKNIKLMLNMLVEDCKTENGKITACIARHSVNNETVEIVSDIYIDATGNGTLAYCAGAEYMIGREGKDKFGEYWAPETSDEYTMGNSIYFETEDMGHEVSFKAPAYAYDITKMDFLKDIDNPENFRGFSVNGPHWAYEFGGQVDILKDYNDTEDELRKLIYGIWDYVKNSGKYPQAKNMQLKRVYARAGMRESRRFVGDYVLNENDIENKINFEDSVAIGGWPMDIHAPLGIYDKLPASNFVSVTGTYNIPFRCLYSENIPNLMMAGRNISASHIALGSTRVMATCGALGQAVGTAAFLCKKYGETPRELLKNHIHDLQQQLLEDDQTILHLKDCVSGGFAASATSEKVYENTHADDFMPLERDYALMLMCETEKVESVDVYVKGRGKLNYKVLTGTHPETYLPETVVSKGCKEITEDGWATLDINSMTGADKKLYIVFEQNDNLSLGIAEKRTMGAVTARMHTEENHDRKNHDSVPLKPQTGYTHFDHAYEKTRNILFKNIVPQQHVFGAEGVINGYSRPYGCQNIWIPGELPATLVLKHKDEGVTADRIDIIFDDKLDSDEGKPDYFDTMAKKYKMKVYTDKGIKEYSADNNFRRVAHHQTDGAKIEKIEITIEESYGETAGIYGIRLI